MPLDETLTRQLKSLLQVQEFGESVSLQSLWSGYGEILRVPVMGWRHPSVIVKHINLKAPSEHPRGWATDIGHQRKLTSYEVEANWYRDHAALCDESCRVAHCHAVWEFAGKQLWLILEDLDASGFTDRTTAGDHWQLMAAIDWLGSFHARFLGHTGSGLWPRGTYWHLATRPHELEALEDQALKKAAPKLDRLLSQSSFQTLVHGDAKMANFCFDPVALNAAAVDFQYVGMGCGMQDLAYLVGSCLGAEECAAQEDRLLDHYFTCLEAALSRRQSTVDIVALEADWRPLYRIAWTDFHRFLKGWNPESWKVHRYSENVAAEVLHKLNLR